MRARGKSPKLGRAISIFPLIGLILLTIGYAVVVAYIFKALVDSATGTLMSVDVGSWYRDLSERDFSVWPYHLCVIILTLINCLGSAKTLEKSSKFMMPAFFILFVVIAIKIISLPNATQGYRYMFRIDRSMISMGNVVSAMGQAFFSLSITGSAMMICGAYLHKDEDIIYSSKMTGLLDTIAAMVAAFVMIPSVIVFSMDQAGGPGLLFQVLPTILQNIEGGRFFSIILYLAVLFAGISSLQIMFEVVVESVTYVFKKLDRKIVLIAIATLVFLVGMNIEKISQWGPFMDIISIYIIPIGAMIGAITWFYVLDKKTLIEEINLGSTKRYGDSWYRIGKYLYTPLVIVICLLTIIM